MCAFVHAYGRTWVGWRFGGRAVSMVRGGFYLILCVGVWVGWKFWVWEGVCSIRCVFRELNKNNVFSCFTENACLCMLQ